MQCRLVHSSRYAEQSRRAPTRKRGGPLSRHGLGQRMMRRYEANANGTVAMAERYYSMYHDRLRRSFQACWSHNEAARSNIEIVHRCFDRRHDPARRNYAHHGLLCGHGDLAVGPSAVRQHTLGSSGFSPAFGFDPADCGGCLSCCVHRVVCCPASPRQIEGSLTAVCLSVDG